MKPSERDAIRARVQAEPNDERGALARLLMEEVDRLYEASERKARADLIAMLIEHDHLSRDEATRYVDMTPMPKIEYEHGTCRACGGRGGDREIGCMGGGRWEHCKNCRGSGKTARLRLPWAPEGPLVTTGLEPKSA